MAMTKEQQKQIFLAVAGGGVFIWFYFTKLLTPVKMEIQQQDSELASVNGRIQGLKATALQRETLLQRVEELKIQVAAVEKRLPRDQNIQEIIRTVQSLAEKNGVRYSSLSPMEEQSAPLFTEIPFAINVSGTVHSIGKFLAALGQQERIFSARNLNLSYSADMAKNQTVTGSFTLVAFVYNG